MLHGRRDEEADADEAEAPAAEADEAEAPAAAVEAVGATWAAPAGPDAAANAARTSAAEVTAHHSAFLRFRAFLRLGVLLRLGSLIVTNLRTG
jgi:hypothetical protein